MGSAPSPPEPTDPKITNSEQQFADIQTLKAERIADSGSQYTPFGEQHFELNGYDTVVDAKGRKIEVPIYDEYITLSDAEQQKYDLENQLALQAGDIATDQLGRLDETLAKPIDFSDLPEIQTDEGYYQDLLFQRLNPQIERDRESFDAQLANQGLARGTEAYDIAQEQLNRNINDNRIGALLAAGQYASQDQARQMALRQQLMQEQVAERSVPINEISALMGQSQVNVPQFQGMQNADLPRVPVSENYQHYDNYRLNAWQTEVQNRNQMLGGLFSLGGSLFGML